MRRIFEATLCLVLLCTCTPGQILEDRSKAPEGQYGLAVVEEVAQGDLGRIRARLIPEAHTPDLEAKLTALSEQIPKVSPSKIRLVGYHAVYGTLPRYQLTFESLYPEGSIVAGVALRAHGDSGDFRLEGINIQKLPAPLDEMHAFTLRGKKSLHYIFIALALVAFGVTIAALVLWRRAGRIHRRWWWLTGILLGVGKIGVQWTTGALIAQPLSVQLFSVGASSGGPFAPWFFTVSIPFGAIAFLIVRPEPVATPQLESGGA